MTQDKEHHCPGNCAVALFPKKPAQGQFCKGVIFITLPNVIVVAGTCSCITINFCLLK